MVTTGRLDEFRNSMRGITAPESGCNISGMIIIRPASGMLNFVLFARCKLQKIRKGRFKPNIS